jgi:CheY-like chemotaxis protein
MKELKLLIVEDDQDAINAYKREIKAFNKERELSFGNDLNIIETSVQEKEEALNILRNSDNIFDAAIVDLDLLGQGGQDSSGNEIIRLIKNNLRFPVFVITGTPQHISDDLKDESSLFKLMTRGDEGDYLNQFVEIYQTGITQILNKKGEIEKYISEIFWNHLSSSLELWINDKTRNSDDKQKSLLRYTLLHIQEYLDVNNTGGLEKYHPAEFFISKPVKRFIFTGDILMTDKDERCVILTPACDIDLKNGKRKADKILTLKIIKLNEIDAEYSNSEMSNNKKQKLQQILNNGNPRYHFIPKAGTIESGAIDFQDKYTIDDKSLEEKIIKEKIERIATISNPFLKDLIARYSNYFSRQGSPDFNQDEIYNSIFDG